MILDVFVLMLFVFVVMLVVFVAISLVFVVILAVNESTVVLSAVRIDVLDAILD